MADPDEDDDGDSGSGGGGVGGGAGAPQAPSAPSAAPPTDEQLAQHLAACAQQLESRQPGQVSYPESLAVPLDGSATYEASIDIRAGAQDQPAPDEDTAVADVEVRCGVGARLTGLGDGITVEDAGEWMYLEFDTPGVFEWAWDVRATEAGDARVKLQLRPAVARRDGGYVVPGNEDPSAPTVTYESVVDVQAGFVDELDAWLRDSWPKIAGAGVVLGGAVLGLTAWGRQFVRTLLGREGSSSAAPAHPRGPVTATARRQKDPDEPDPDEDAPGPVRPEGPTRAGPRGGD